MVPSSPLLRPHAGSRTISKVVILRASLVVIFAFDLASWPVVAYFLVAVHRTEGYTERRSLVKAPSLGHVK